MRVYLTGGTGLVGSHVAERLRARGDDVVALVRPSSDVAHLVSVGAGLVEGDLLDAAGAHAGRAKECDAVVHAGAVVFTRAPAETFRRVNVEGTASVLSGAAAAGVRRVVHVSSIAVYGGEARRAPLREESWLADEIPPSAAYARSKRGAERTAWALAATAGLELTTVRPGVIYGERDRAFAPILAKLVRMPLLPLPGGGTARLAVVYAGSVAAGILATLDRPAAVGRAFNMAADTNVSVRELVERFAAALGRGPRLVTVPGRPIRVVAEGLEALMRVFAGAHAPRLSRGVRRLLEDHPYDDSRAREELGWGAEVPLEEAVRRTAAWIARAEEEV